MAILMWIRTGLASPLHQLEPREWTSTPPPRLIRPPRYPRKFVFMTSPGRLPINNYSRSHPSALLNTE